MTNTKEELCQIAALVDARLASYLSNRGADARRLWEAMRYSAGSGGKRIRPYLTYKAAEMLGGDTELALVFGTALEMIHTYSLIHDDLPCMDNDDYRRGKLTCHKMFDEATALLAGDALLTMAFEVIAQCDATDKQKVAAMSLLASAAGARGMIGGQTMDLAAEHVSISFEQLNRLYNGKTGALIRAAVLLGCVASDVYDGDVYTRLSDYAEKIGLVFQIVDDVLDVTGNETLGKPIGSDVKNGKNTYLSFMSVAEAADTAMRLTAEAKTSLASFEGSQELCNFADLMATRTK